MPQSSPSVLVGDPASAVIPECSYRESIAFSVLPERISRESSLCPCPCFSLSSVFCPLSSALCIAGIQFLPLPLSFPNVSIGNLVSVLVFAFLCLVLPERFNRESILCFAFVLPFLCPLPSLPQSKTLLFLLLLHFLS